MQQTEKINGSLQELRNNVFCIERGIIDARQALREIVPELKPLAEEEAVERLAVVRFNLARAALKLEGHLLQIQEIRDMTRKLAGQKAMENAAKPITFER